MTLPADLDAWAAALATTLALPVTRDPDLVHPPCVFVGLPDTVAGTLPAATLDVPVWLTAPGVGKQAGDVLLTHLVAFMDALGVKDAQASPLQLPGSQKQLHAYQAVARLYVTPTASPAPPEPTIPAPPGEPFAYNWLETSGSWQFDLAWPLSPDDGGSPILRHYVLIDGNLTVVDGNTGILGAQFSDHYPIDVSVEAVNAVGNSFPSSATITHP